MIFSFSTPSLMLQAVEEIANKRLTIYTAPNVVVIQLKRFSADEPDLMNENKVRFDLKLDLKPYFIGSHVSNRLF